jgi:hypothetical protein
MQYGNSEEDAPREWRAHGGNLTLRASEHFHEVDS